MSLTKTLVGRLKKNESAYYTGEVFCTAFKDTNIVRGELISDTGRIITISTKCKEFDEIRKAFGSIIGKVTLNGVSQSNDHMKLLSDLTILLMKDRELPESVYEDYPVVKVRGMDGVYMFLSLLHTAFPESLPAVDDGWCHGKSNIHILKSVQFGVVTNGYISKRIVYHNLYGKLQSILDLRSLIATVYSSKLNKSGGTMSGQLSVSHIATTQGITAEWTSGRLYPVGTVVAYDGRLYLCKVEHTSGNSFDISYWNSISSAGASELIITSSITDLNPGECIVFGPSGISRAIATSEHTLADAIVVKNYGDGTYSVASTGIITFSSPLFAGNTVYYLSDTTPGVVTTIPSQEIVQPLLYALSETTAIITLSHFSTGVSIGVYSFNPTYEDDNTFTLPVTPVSKDAVIVTVNGISLDPAEFTLDGRTITIPLDAGEHLLTTDTITVRLLYGENITVHQNIIDGYTVGNSSGEVPINNGIKSILLNADLIDGYHAGNSSGDVPIKNSNLCTSFNADMLDPLHAGNDDGQIPINNGTKCTNLNADMLDGYHAGSSSGDIPVNSGVVCTSLNADMVDGYHASDIIDTIQQPSITYLSKSGHNVMAIVCNGKLYTTSGSNANYDVYTTGRHSNAPTHYGVDNFKIVPRTLPLYRTYR